MDNEDTKHERASKSLTGIISHWALTTFSKEGQVLYDHNGVPVVCLIGTIVVVDYYAAGQFSTGS